jgi:F-type H+-transporting ATPase subunit b
MMGRAILLLALFLLFGPEAWAAGVAGGEEHAAAHGPDWWQFGRHVLNLSILIGVLIYFAGPALRDFFKQRSENIRREIEAAETALRAAEAEMAELRTRLSAFDEESRRLAEAVAETAEFEKARVLERARQTAERIREDAKRVADQELARARQELHARAVMLATEIAAEVLREQTSAEDDRRLVSEFTERMGASA